MIVKQISFRRKHKMKITREMALEIVLRLANDPDGRVRADAYANILMPQDKLSKVVKIRKQKEKRKLLLQAIPILFLRIWTS